MILKVLVYAYTTGTFSSHKIACKLATKKGSAHYRRRKYLAEPPFGWIKSCLGF